MSYNVVIYETLIITPSTLNSCKLTSEFILHPLLIISNTFSYPTLMNFYSNSNKYFSLISNSKIPYSPCHPPNSLVSSIFLPILKGQKTAFLSQFFAPKSLSNHNMLWSNSISLPQNHISSSELHTQRVWKLGRRPLVSHNINQFPIDKNFISSP